MIAEVAERRTRDIPETDLPVLGYREWLTGLQRGIAAHHAGMLPTFKEVVEELFEAGLVRAVFATETLALGINIQARTVVIERMDKWNGETHADLTPGEYTQLTGRPPGHRRGGARRGALAAGRGPTGRGRLAGTRTYPLNSSFRPSYNMAVNLVGQAGLDQAAALLESLPFAQFQADRAVVGIARQARRGRDALAELGPACDLGDYAVPRAAPGTGRAGGRRIPGALGGPLDAGPAVTGTAPPGGHHPGPGQAPAGPRGHPGPRYSQASVGRPPAGANDPLPLVLAANRQVKRLSQADFPVPGHRDRPAAHPEQLQRPLPAAPPGPGLDHASQGRRAGPQPPAAAAGGAAGASRGG